MTTDYSMTPLRTEIKYSLRVFPVGPEGTVCWVHCGFYRSRERAQEALIEIEKRTAIAQGETMPVTVILDA